MDAAMLFSSLLIGTVGFAMFIFGKKAQDIPFLLCGIVLMIYPYFVHSTGIMWLIAAGCVGGMLALKRFGPAL